MRTHRLICMCSRTILSIVTWSINDIAILARRPVSTSPNRCSFRYGLWSRYPTQDTTTAHQPQHHHPFQQPHGRAIPQTTYTTNESSQKSAVQVTTDMQRQRDKYNKSSCTAITLRIIASYATSYRNTPNYERNKTHTSSSKTNSVTTQPTLINTHIAAYPQTRINIAYPYHTQFATNIQNKRHTQHQFSNTQSIPYTRLFEQTYIRVSEYYQHMSRVYLIVMWIHSWLFYE